MSLATKSLRKSSKNESTNSYIDVIDSEINRLKIQVDKILQLSLLNAGVVQLQEQTVDIYKQILEVTENLKLVAEEKMLQFSLIYLQKIISFLLMMFI